MVNLEISSLVRRVEETLTDAERRSVRIKNHADDGHAESGAAFFIEGVYCLTSIGVWPHGLCDVDWIYISDENGEFIHKEFFDVSDVAPFVVTEIRKAFERERSRRLAYESR